MFIEYYREEFARLFGGRPELSDGLGDEVVQAKLTALGLTIPTSLFDYYSVAGLHWINDNHDRLRPIAELEWMDDKLVFLEENQAVCYWGIRRDDLDVADPAIWRGDKGKPIEWTREGPPLSQFLMALWKWNMTGEWSPPPGER
jgi:hypothetical protein